LMYAHYWSLLAGHNSSSSEQQQQQPAWGCHVSSEDGTQVTRTCASVTNSKERCPWQTVGYAKLHLGRTPNYTRLQSTSDFQGKQDFRR
jgi:hypothetical protein